MQPRSRMRPTGPFYASPESSSKNRAEKKTSIAICQVHFYIYVADFLLCASEHLTQVLSCILWNFQSEEFLLSTMEL